MQTCFTLLNHKKNLTTSKITTLFLFKFICYFILKELAALIVSVTLKFLK